MADKTDTERIAYLEKRVSELQKELAETKIKGALKVALLSAKALDIDYLTYKVNEKLRGEGKTLEVDENENIKNNRLALLVRVSALSNKIADLTKIVQA